MATLMTTLTEHLKSFSRVKKISAKQQSYFLQTIAELLEQGFSLNQALHFIQLLLPRYQVLIQSMVTQLEQGKPFEKALQQVGFPLFVVAQLFYAQRQGRFVASLHDNARHLHKIQRYKQQVVQKLSYPLLMSVFLIVLLFGMRSFMLPHILSFLTPDVYESPGFVRMLVLFFTYLPQGFMSVVAISLLMIGVTERYLMRLKYIERYQRLRHIPFIKKWTKLWCTYKVSKELGYFFTAGYSIQQLLEVLIQYPVDPFLAEIAQLFKKGLSQGEALGTIIERSGLFTQEFKIVLYQGELTSQMAQKSLLYADKLLTDLMEDVQRKLSWIQPILFALIALFVMAMYLMMLLPMLTMDGF